jgi:ABC-type sugar transport system ATPase subunit
LLISSDLTEAIGASDRLMVMREGELVSELDPASTTEEEVLAHSIGSRT